MSGSEKSLEETVVTPELERDQLKSELDAVREQLESEKLRVQSIDSELETHKKLLVDEQSLREALDAQLKEKTKQYEKAENDLKERTNELEALKVRRFNPNHLAWIGISLFILLVISSAIIANHILTDTNISWRQICGVLGLYLLCVTFAAVSMRLLSDRCR